MKKQKEIKEPVKTTIIERFSKINVVTGLLVCLALSFTVCFFSPIDIFLSSQAEFFVGFSIIAPTMLLVALGVFVFIFALLLLCLTIREKLFKTVCYLMLGLLITMYLQMMFFNGGMTLVTGDVNDYLDINFRNYFNLIIYIVLIFVPLIIWLAVKEYPDNKLLKKFSQKTAAFAAGLLIAVQIVGIIGTVFSCGIEKRDDELGVAMLSYSSSLCLSPDENVVVFLTDRLDGTYMDDTLEEFPELYDILDGFTYYRNNVAKYTNTFPSVPEMLTAREFDDSKRGEYLSKAWTEDPMLKKLKDEGFRINGIADVASTLLSITYVKDIFDTYKVFNISSTINYTDRNGIVETMLNMSLLKLSPYFLKSAFSNYMAGWAPSDFFIVERDDPDAMKGIVTDKSDVEFYNALCRDGLNLDSENKTFSFIHLNGSHDYSREVCEIYPGYGEKTGVDSIVMTTRGEFEILNEYFSQMKELGIYDSSTIIILGDHGHPPYETQGGADRLSEEITTGLLIKRAGAESSPMKTDSETQLSNALFPASIMEYCGLDHSEYGVSYEDVIVRGASPERIINIYNNQGSNVSPKPVCRYRVTGDAHDFGCWEYIE